MQEYDFVHRMSVRDYECDLQGIVNNAVYQNYLEHVRHEYLRHVGINFAEYAARGIHFVVTRAELDYKLPLKAGDEFWVGLNMKRESRVRYAFYQDIYRATDDKLSIAGKIIGTALNERGRPEVPEEVAKLLGE
ncbi:MAG: acyl-CoA thioesterase [Deltaproteobacteria bacterium]|nr:acyl-CoA thioesterase [Deltaproteobacteria bacterium]